MILINSKNHQIVSRELQMVSNFIDKTLGLLKKASTSSLLFKTRFGIHTFFLKKPIDVLICDENLQVKSFKKSLVPNRIYLWNPMFNTVLELPEGSIKKSEISVGDTLNIHNPGETW